MRRACASLTTEGLRQMPKKLLLLLLLLLATIALAQDPRIKTGDTLRMTCEEEPTLNKEYTVTQQGMVLVDFLGAVKVEGMTEREAAKAISDRLVNERILRRATVTVRIARTNVAPVTYRGAVRQTGQEPYRDGLRLSDIVKKAQPRDDTDLARIEVRNKDGKAQTVDFTRFDPATNASNPLLQPGDTVTFLVKTAPGLVVVLGGVERPGGVTWERGMTVRTAIAKAGGLAALGVASAVRLERQGQQPLTLDLTDAKSDAPVHEGDRIIVSTKEERAYVTVSGAVMGGGFIEHKPGMTLSQAITTAGGLRPDANPQKVRLTRNGESRSTTYVWTDLTSGRATDPVLNSGDKVMVDAKSQRRNELLQTLTMLALLYILIGR